jgi:putative Mg2+ transporter-C (MgtC) family protein
VFHTDLHLLARVAVGFAMSYAFGFERQLRGSPAGDRTFTLVGTVATAVTAVAYASSPQAVAGILTGVGFIGAGMVFVHGVSVRGLTTAATVFAVAGIGIVVGFGHMVLGVVVTAALLFILEIQHLPIARFLDAETFASRFANDAEGPPLWPGGGSGAGGAPGGPTDGTADPPSPSN